MNIQNISKYVFKLFMRCLIIIIVCFHNMMLHLTIRYFIFIYTLSLLLNLNSHKY